MGFHWWGSRKDLGWIEGGKAITRIVLKFIFNKEITHVCNKWYFQNFYRMHDISNKKTTENKIKGHNKQLNFSKSKYTSVSCFPYKNIKLLIYEKLIKNNSKATSKHYYKCLCVPQCWPIIYSNVFLSTQTLKPPQCPCLSS